MPGVGTRVLQAPDYSGVTVLVTFVITLDVVLSKHATEDHILSRFMGLNRLVQIWQGYILLRKNTAAIALGIIDFQIGYKIYFGNKVVNALRMSVPPLAGP